MNTVIAENNGLRSQYNFIISNFMLFSSLKFVIQKVFDMIAHAVKIMFKKNISILNFVF